MAFRLLIGIGLAAVVSLAAVLGAIQFTGGEAEAQPPDIEIAPCLLYCLGQEANFDGQNGFTIEDILLAAEAYDTQTDVCDPAYPCDPDGDGDIDVFDLLHYAGKVRDCIATTDPCPPSP